MPVKIVRIEHDRHRLGLSLRQAHDKAEEDGWAFNDSGGVVSAPPEALARLDLEEAPEAVAEEAEAVEVEQPEATCVMTRKDAITCVGMMDERFSMFFNDVDWCRRFRLEGWKIVFIPTARVKHLKGSSV